MKPPGMLAVWIVAAALSIAIAAWQEWAAHPATVPPAQPSTQVDYTVTVPDTAQYTVNDGWALPDGTVLWSNGGNLPPTLVPYDFAAPFVVIVQCEDAAGAGPAAVGDEGRALGRAQLRVDVHTARMLAMGCDPMWEPDRIWYSGSVLFPESGWTPWRTCAEKAGLLP